MLTFGLFFLIIHCLRNLESSPDTYVHVYVPPEQGRRVEIEIKTMSWLSNALCSKGCHLKKSYHEMFNFENWFLCQFSSNTRFSFGGGSLNTPKIGKRKKEFTNINLRGFKTQKTWRGCFSRIKRVSTFLFSTLLVPRESTTIIGERPWSFFCRWSVYFDHAAFDLNQALLLKLITAYKPYIILLSVEIQMKIEMRNNR